MNNLQNAFDLLGTISDKLVKEENFLKILEVDNKENYELLSRKVNLQELNMNFFEPKNMPLVSIYIPDADVTNNFLVNHALLRIESFTPSRVKAKELIKTIRSIMREDFNLYTVAEGQQPCDIKNVYKYRLEYLPTIFS